MMMMMMMKMKMKTKIMNTAWWLMYCMRCIFYLYVCDVFPKSTNSMENHWGWRGFGFLPSFQILIETRPGRHCWWLCILRRLTFLLLTKNGTGYVEANGAHEKHDLQIMKIHLFPIPKQSMYGMFTHISNKNKPMWVNMPYMEKHWNHIFPMGKLLEM